MARGLSLKMVSASVCLGICLLAQAEVQPPSAQRLPGEPPPPDATQWGSTGSGDGEFDNPYGVAVAASGNFYVADSDNHRIQKFDSSGTFLTQWGSSGRR
jgi:hypothetical protein